MPITLNQLEQFIRETDPFFYQYKLGDKIVFRYNSHIQEGIVQRLDYNLNWNGLSPRYHVKYGEKDYEYHFVDENEIISNVKEIAEYKKLSVECQKQAEKLHQIEENLYNLYKKAR